MKLEGKLVLLTGASGGIGEALAQELAAQGAHLLLHGRRAGALERLCKELPHPERHQTVIADLGSPQERARLLQHPALDEGLDVLINNAGAFAQAKFVETSVADFDRMIAVNLRSAFLVTRAFVPAMIARGAGDVFFMSSIAGLGAYPNAAAYCAAKFGVTGLAKVLRAETKDKGIRVCCVHPGATWSPSWEKSGVKPERIMPAEDIARAILDVHRLSRRTVVEEIVLRPQLGDV